MRKVVSQGGPRRYVLTPDSGYTEPSCGYFQIDIFKVLFEGFSSDIGSFSGQLTELTDKKVDNEVRRKYSRPGGGMRLIIFS